MIEDKLKNQEKKLLVEKELSFIHIDKVKMMIFSSTIMRNLMMDLLDLA